MKPYAEKFYKSKTWQNTRDAYSRSKSFLCETCLEQGKISPGEVVHHVRPITKDNINNPAITLNWDNLRLLCRECHEKAHRRTPRRYSIDALGHVTAVTE